MEDLTFVHIMKNFVLPLLLSSLGRVLGIPRPLVGFVSLFGRRLGIKFGLVIILSGGGILYKLVLHVSLQL